MSWVRLTALNLGWSFSFTIEKYRQKRPSLPINTAVFNLKSRNSPNRLYALSPALLDVDVNASQTFLARNVKACALWSDNKSVLKLPAWRDFGIAPQKHKTGDEH